MATPRSDRNPLFLGRWFEDELIVLCVRWYLEFKLSYRDLVRMMADRGVRVSHTTILRWVLHYAPEFEKKWKRYAKPVGLSWRMDETYVKVRGEWTYLSGGGRRGSHGGLLAQQTARRQRREVLSSAGAA